MASKDFKYKLYTALMYLSIYLLIVAIPFDMFLDHNFHYMVVMIAKVILSFVLIFVFKKEGFAFESFSLKNSLLYLPVILLCGSNLIFLVINNADYATNPAFVNLINSFFYCFATALAEELIFRAMAVDIVKSKFNKLMTVLVTALVFGLVHFIAGVFSNPLGAATQAGYTFILGLVVGFAYCYGGGIYTAVMIHFLFNFLNDGLFPLLYDGGWNATFYLVNVGVGALVLVYLVLIYLLKFRKSSQN